MTIYNRALSAVAVVAMAAAGCGTSVEPAPLEWVDQASGTSAPLRGTSVVSDSVAWASGLGTVVRTIDGGETWTVRTVPGLDEDELRDIEALSADVAWVMAVGPGSASRIYKTSDGGDSWTLQFTSDYPEAFFSAMAFWNERRGIAVAGTGDNRRFVVVLTDDGGATWTRVEPDNLPTAQEGEGFWAATGTNVALMGENHVWLATSRSRVLRSADGGRTWQVSDSPLVSGENFGARSIMFRDPMHGISVGGDVQKRDEAIDNMAMTTDGGVTWTLVRGPDGQPSALSGNRTAVSYIPGTSQILAVGQNGADLSRDDGRTWTRIEVPVLPGSDMEVPALLGLDVAPSGRVAWTVGGRGRIMRIAGF
jgi:photosystem II stability/assembly factor-like uncharacterized protein